MLFFLSFHYSGLFADEYSIDEITAYIIENNPELQNARYDYKAALRDRLPAYDYRGIGLNYSGSYSDYPGSQPEGTHSVFDNTLNLVIPIIDQITLEGTMVISTNTDAIEEPEATTVNGGAGIVITPFENTWERAASHNEEINARNALNALQASTYFESRVAVLEYLIAKQESELAEEKLQLTQKSYEQIKQQYSLGEATYQELRESSDSTGAVRAGFAEKRIALVNAKDNLFMMIGPQWPNGEPEGSIREYPLESLLKEIELLQERIDKLEPSVVRSSTLEELELDLLLFQEQKRKTYLYEPELFFSVNISSNNITSETPPRITATLGFTLSPGNINTAEREDREQQVLETRKAITMERYSIKSEFSIAQERISESNFIYELAKSSYEEAVLVYEEAIALAEYGERTPLELQQMEWDMKNAKQDLYRQAAIIYAYQGALLKMFY
jgi:hypothetical protein